jgi:histidine triad (HIT) family protein
MTPTPHTTCIFCKIADGDASAEIIFKDDRATAFWDAHPAAPLHILIIPNRHITSVNDVTPQDEQIIGHLFFIARHIAEMHEIHQAGYRIIINSGRDAGQTVMHLHLHLLGGRHLGHHLRW